MAQQQPYTTYQELKSYLRLTDSSDDPYLKLLIPKVMGFIDRYTHRTFGWGNPADPTDMTMFKDIATEIGCANGEIYDGLNGKIIYLNNVDIRDVYEVKLGISTMNSWQVLQPGNYIWRDDGRLIMGGNYFNSFYQAGEENDIFGTLSSGYQTITVKYHYGYYGVPPEISLACLEICAALFVLRKNLGIKQERIGDWQVDYQANIRAELKNQPDTLNSLNMFRKINVSVVQ